tara:strand:+ start:6658 stop:8505 length:1848 start_codon:yes stop_codon:yes gene_type:complete
MSSIEYLKTVDPKIVQNEPAFSINEGATEISNVPFTSTNASRSSLSYNVNAPSQNVFVDREATITTEVLRSVDVVITNTVDNPRPASGQVLKWGQNCALPAFPLQSQLQTSSVTINNATITENTKDIIYEKLRLTHNDYNTKRRTTPSMLDNYASYQESAQLKNSPLAGYDSIYSNDNIPNGSFPITYTSANGTPLSDQTFYRWDNDALWLLSPPVGNSFTRTIYYKYKVTEKILLSPFIWAEIEGKNNVDLYGINNIQFIFTIAGDTSRNLRFFNNDTDDYNFTNIQLNGQNPFVNPVMNFVFRTPSLSIPLPERSVVPYMETPRHISTNSGVSIPPGATKMLNMSGITLTQIPDLIVVYTKANPVTKPEQYGDFYLPPVDISMMFDNRSGLLSSMTQEQLFKMSLDNGLNMNWNEFQGTARTGNGNEVSTVGGFLVLQPGVDFPLSSGSAPGLGGNYNIQLNITVKNQLKDNVENPIVYLMAVNSGFFTSNGGSSRVSTAPLTQNDIIEAPLMGSTNDYERMVGNGKFGDFFKKLGSNIKKVFKNKDVQNVLKEGAKIGSKIGSEVLKNSGDPRLALTGELVNQGTKAALGSGRTTGGGKNYNLYNSNLRALM